MDILSGGFKLFYILNKHTETDKKIYFNAEVG